ncbi:MAG TPA: hypothetical protein DCE41_11050 [Cytophagales bacterium]|nr:hypothetical protein [Cytophagales bacterium]HAA20069.1 hypothetical protein [Cytophagales bacterium]
MLAMDEKLQDLLETIVNVGGLLTSITLSIYFVARYNFKVKKAIADNGGDPYANRSQSRFLEFGVILVCLGLGIASLSALSKLGISEDDRGFLSFGILFLFGGTGLILAHLIRKRFGGQK